HRLPSALQADRGSSQRPEDRTALGNDPIRRPVPLLRGAGRRQTLWSAILLYRVPALLRARLPLRVSFRRLPRQRGAVRPFLPRRAGKREDPPPARRLSLPRLADGIDSGATPQQLRGRLVVPARAGGLYAAQCGLSRRI